MFNVKWAFIRTKNNRKRKKKLTRKNWVEYVGVLSERVKSSLTYHHLNICNFENDYIELIDERMLCNFRNYFHRNEFLDKVKSKINVSKDNLKRKEIPVLISPHTLQNRLGTPIDESSAWDLTVDCCISSIDATDNGEFMNVRLFFKGIFEESSLFK